MPILSMTGAEQGLVYTHRFVPSPHDHAIKSPSSLHLVALFAVLMSSVRKIGCKLDQVLPVLCIPVLEHPGDEKEIAALELRSVLVVR